MILTTIYTIEDALVLGGGVGIILLVILLLIGFTIRSYRKRNGPNYYR